jgi:hypothetical protein
MTLPLEPGDRFGYLEIIGDAPSRNGRRKVVLVRCKCGVEFETLAQNIRTGKSRSCGCRKIELLKKRHTKHGMSKTSEYYTWAAMKDRCFNVRNKKYADYGGRGITVCAEWTGSDGFRSFLFSVGRKPGKSYELDRIENNGNYEPGNVRWAKRADQNRNTRRNRLVEHAGRTWCVVELAERYGLNRSTLTKRLNSGWSVEEAVKT